MEERGATAGSPGVSRVNLSDCLEHLLKFILESPNTLALSPDFSSTLLKHDDPDLHHQFQLPSTSNDFTQGVPPYPLYKRVASALQQWILSGSMRSTSENVAVFCEDVSLREMKHQWDALVSEKGYELVNALKSIKAELHVQEPYFSQLKDGLKTIEGRCAVGDYNRIQSGDMIFFNKCLMLEVQDIRHYSSFFEMLEAENLGNVLPGVLTIEEGAKIYRKFYTKEKEQMNGVLAISVGRPASQPYMILSDIISGLGYRGIQSLLGIKQTVGTVPEALPPPRSTLYSSFELPHSSNAKGCTLTEGARALTKHVLRCSSNSWGKVEGNDSNKNKVAMKVITRILDQCQWLNIYTVQPHGDVFEIRNLEGYGARWSKDGTKFIGFLEPYMEDGHAKKWRH